MNTAQQRLCVFGGPAILVFVFIGLVVAGWLPPPDPDMTTDEVARMYSEDKDAIRAGAILVVIGGCMQGVFVTAISVQLSRIEGRRTPMTFAQLGFGFIGVLLFLIPAFCWEAAAYRPERDPELTQMLHDFGWIPFVSAVVPAILQNIAIGVAVLSDKRSEPVFPRWLGYFNFYVAIVYIPAAFVMFFKDGALAWDGLIAWWVLVTDFTIWVGVLTYLLLRAIRSEDAEETVREPAAVA